jgi:LAO/AO transport system kinase
MHSSSGSTAPPLPDHLAALVAGVRRGDRRLLARAISVVENERPGFEALLHALLTGGDVAAHAHAPPGVRVGITGPPGAGKSSLVTAMARTHLDRGETVGVVAVDPTSPFSGGALLGDRIRMNDLALEPGLFIRSMASRGSLGGLATTTTEVLDVMDAARFPFLLVETVGVGQTELEIAGAADTVVVVLVPESGDGIQAMKAGLMEIADLFVVNKSDRPGADRLVRELRTAIHYRSGPAGGGAGGAGMAAASGHHGVDFSRMGGPAAEAGQAARVSAAATEAGAEAATEAATEAGTGSSRVAADVPAVWTPEVLQTVAQTGDGVPELLEAIERHRAWMVASGVLAQRRKARMATRIRDVMERALKRRVRGHLANPAHLGPALEAIARGSTPYAEAVRLLEALRHNPQP